MLTGKPEVTMKLPVWIIPKQKRRVTLPTITALSSSFETSRCGRNLDLLESCRPMSYSDPCTNSPTDSGRTSSVVSHLGVGEVEANQPVPRNESDFPISQLSTITCQIPEYSKDVDSFTSFPICESLTKQNGGRFNQNVQSDQTDDDATSGDVWRPYYTWMLDIWADLIGSKLCSKSSHFASRRVRGDRRSLLETEVVEHDVFYFCFHVFNITTRLSWIIVFHEFLKFEILSIIIKYCDFVN